MNKPLSTIVSVSDVIYADEPKTLASEALIRILRKRFKELKIVWVPINFRQALENPKLPKWLLRKLENLIAAAEFSGWKISNSLRYELDETVEDIETFNPAYREAVKRESRQAMKDFKAGKFFTSEQVKAELGIK